MELVLQVGSFSYSSEVSVILFEKHLPPQRAAQQETKSGMVCVCARTECRQATQKIQLRLTMDQPVCCQVQAQGIESRVSRDVSLLTLTPMDGPADSGTLIHTTIGMIVEDLALCKPPLTNSMRFCSELPRASLSQT